MKIVVTITNPVHHFTIHINICVWNYIHACIKNNKVAFYQVVRNLFNKHKHDNATTSKTLEGINNTLVPKKLSSFFSLYRRQPSSNFSSSGLKSSSTSSSFSLLLPRTSISSTARGISTIHGQTFSLNLLHLHHMWALSAHKPTGSGLRKICSQVICPEGASGRRRCRDWRGKNIMQSNC